jgi:hypothetical protein
LKTLFALIFSLGVAHATPLPFSASGVDGSQMPDLTHQGPKEFDTYLSLSLPYLPSAELRTALEGKLKRELKNRGEAHVTIVTPVEFWQVLKPLKITMDEIEALSSDRQNTAVEAVCLGRGRTVLNGKPESTYYVVVRSKGLFELRKRVEELYLSRGGIEGGFRAEHYFPHITLGYTERDLHESDNVIKGENTCAFALNVQ